MAFDKSCTSSTNTGSSEISPPAHSGGEANETREGVNPHLSPPAEAVLRFGFSRDLVLRVYQRLKASSVSHPENGDATRSFGSEVSDGSDAFSRNEYRITAAVLLVAVERENVTHGNSENEEPNAAPDTFHEVGPLLGNVVRNDDETAHAYGSEIIDSDNQEVISPSLSHDASNSSPGRPAGEDQADLLNVAKGEPTLSPTCHVGTDARETRRQGRDRSCSPSGSSRRLELERLRALRVENRRLRARNTCRQCRERPASLTLLPCGHFCFCVECGSAFRTCPVCRKTILADVRTFVA